MKTHTTQIELAGRSATLTADNRAKFRFQEQGGSIDELFGSRSYLHCIRMLWACLDAETRERFPTPEDLCDHVPDEKTPIHIALFSAVNEAGWLPTVDDLRKSIQASNDALEKALEAENQ